MCIPPLHKKLQLSLRYTPRCNGFLPHETIQKGERCMNYTDKYHLPQWEETDRIMRTDFNQMCADMEAGLTKTARDAAADTAEARSVDR